MSVTNVGNPPVKYTILLANRQDIIAAGLLHSLL